MNLKPYMDAVTVAQDEKIEVAGRIDALMLDGKTDDALALQPELDEAEAKEQAAQKLYNSMKNVSGNEDSVAHKFVPAAEEQDEQLEEPQRDKTVKTRSEFDALNARARMEFVQAGGKVIPDEAQS